MQFVVGGGQLDCQYYSCLGGGSKPAGHNGIRCGPYYNVNLIATYFLSQTAACKYVTPNIHGQSIHSTLM